MKKQANTPTPLRRALYLFTFFTLFLFSPKSFAQSHPWVTPKLAQNTKNPIAPNASALSDGKALYAANCSPCHGDKGKGNGPAAQALTPKPADHTSATVQSESDGSLFWKLTEGRSPMPSYKAALSDKQRWELIAYIRTLAKH